MRCFVKKATEVHEICLLSSAEWSVFVCLLPNVWGLQNASYVGRYQNATHVFITLFAKGVLEDCSDFAVVAVIISDLAPMPF